MNIIDIIHKVLESSKDYMDSVVYSRNPFGFVSSDRFGTELVVGQLVATACRFHRHCVLVAELEKGVRRGSGNASELGYGGFYRKGIR